MSGRTAERGQIPSLDGMRAFAVLLVVVGHAGVRGVPATAGVTIFFFLSGYLITTLMRMEFERTGRVRLGHFYLRRALRILPSLYLTLAAILLLNLTGVIPDGFHGWGTLAAALHFSNYWQAMGFTSLPRGSGIFWSVAVEEHFYLLFPLLYLALRRRLAPRQQALALSALCLVVCAWRVLLSHESLVSSDWIHYATDCRADSILWGCVAAVWRNPYLDPVQMPRWVAGWVAVPVGLAVVLAVPYLRGQNLAYTVQGLALLAVFTAIVAHPDMWAGRLLNWGPVAQVGVLSYGIYLVHRLVQIPLQESWHLTWPVVLPVSLASAIAIAWVLHRYVEVPAGRLRKRLAHTGLGSQPGGAPAPEQPQSLLTEAAR